MKKILNESELREFRENLNDAKYITFMIEDGTWRDVYLRNGDCYVFKDNLEQDEFTSGYMIPNMSEDETSYMIGIVTRGMKYTT